MKKITLTLAAIAMSIASFAQSWTIDPAHSKLQFSTKYLVISDVDGEFKKFDGTVSSTKADWSDLNLTLSVDVKSIDTDNEKRDGHLKSDDFFNADSFPTITFKSKGIRMISKGKYVLTGDLTIRDVTKTVSLPLVYNGTVKDPWGNTKAGFKATGKINRQDYKLRWDKSTEAGEAVASNDVEFTADIILIKK